MTTETHRAANWMLPLSIFLGLALLGWQLGSAAIRYREYERTVTVKGLAEREVHADVVIWPIQFTAAGNDLDALYGEIEQNTQRIRRFLAQNGIDAKAVSESPPTVTDKSAQQWGGSDPPEFRYSAVQTVTVYTSEVAKLRDVMGRLSALGREGIVFTGFGATTEYVYTGLNDIKPAMIEEATRNAREVATKFAEDSRSTLGKIRRASQGQFSIESRDTSTPQIKKLRVVSTIEYYLSD